MKNQTVEFSWNQKNLQCSSLGKIVALSRENKRRMMRGDKWYKREINWISLLLQISPILSKTCSGQFSLTRDKSNDCVVSPMYVPSISKPILFILQCKTTVWQWSTMGHFLIQKKLLRDKLKLQGQGLRETLKKGKKINTLSPLNSSFHIWY